MNEQCQRLTLATERVVVIGQAGEFAGWLLALPYSSGLENVLFKQQCAAQEMEEMGMLMNNLAVQCQP